ncbi:MULTISPECIES: class I SAM-dependent methyltransferase [unclassified Legionella]|uniref:class I SAM-dependent methyltransferase n=1 Tax=unclassified Legionella TaxID=2622702 RepID=UPI001056A754|nr:MULTISPECIES: class I SAM-dependent methyltransferase [unclassified Legionella]MDI9819406.1 class I SAM-dependent methyltransferase [Legionella sp. PL877]
MNDSIAIGYESAAQVGKAQQLAKQLGLRLDNQAKDRLLVTADRVVLKINGFSPLYADFSRQTWQKRRDAGKKQGLIRACKPTKGLRIIDATAGWGRDAAVLASFGAEVIMLERQPIMAALLADALMRRDDSSKKSLQLQLHPCNALDFLHNLAPQDYPDVIYIDPMHPERQKSALVKKDMQVLQKLIDRQDDSLELLVLAKARVSKRVVVKWPQGYKPLLPPDFSIEGKTVRFDVYIPVDRGGD